MRHSLLLAVPVLLLAGPRAFAQQAKPVATAPVVGNFSVPHPWDDGWVRQHYQMGTGVPVLSQLANGMSDAGMLDAMDPFDPATAQRLAGQCKAAYPNDSWGQIHCAAQSTDQYLQATQKYDDVGRGAGLRSFCRDHAHLFAMTFSNLGIQGATNITLSLSEHIVNRVTITADNGEPYSYIIDTGWAPDEIYPYGNDARDYLKDHGNTLPAIEGNKGIDPLALQLPLPYLMTGRNVLDLAETYHLPFASTFLSHTGWQIPVAPGSIPGQIITTTATIFATTLNPLNQIIEAKRLMDASGATHALIQAGGATIDGAKNVVGFLGDVGGSAIHDIGGLFGFGGGRHSDTKAAAGGAYTLPTSNSPPTQNAGFHR